MNQMDYACQYTVKPKFSECKTRVLVRINKASAPVEILQAFRPETPDTSFTHKKLSRFLSQREKPSL